MPATTAGSNSLVKAYREWYRAKNGRDDIRSDDEITVSLGTAARARNNYSLEEEFPDFRDNYLSLTQDTGRGPLDELGAGVSRAWEGLKGTAKGAAALAADWAPDWMVDPDTARAMLRDAADAQQEGPAPTVQRMGDVRDFRTAGLYAMGKIGEAVPSLAESAVTATVGAVVGGAATSPSGPGAAGSAVVGGVGGWFAKSAIKNLLRKGVREAVELGSEEAIKKALVSQGGDAIKSLFRREVRALGARRGAMLASAANSYALSAGEQYMDLTSDPAVPPERAREIATAFGIPAALADTALPGYIASKFLRGVTGPAAAEATKNAGGFFKRFVKESGITIPAEAGTEAFQELVGIAAQKYGQGGKDWTLTDSDRERIVEAAIGGMAGGFLGAPIAAAGSGAQPQPAPQVQPAQKPKTTPVVNNTARVAPTTTTPAEPAAPTMSQLVAMSLDAKTARLTELQDAAATRKLTKDEQAQVDYLKSKVKPAAPQVPAAPTPQQAQAKAATVSSNPNEIESEDRRLQTINHLVTTFGMNEEDVKALTLAQAEAELVRQADARAAASAVAPNAPMPMAPTPSPQASEATGAGIPGTTNPGETPAPAGTEGVSAPAASPQPATTEVSNGLQEVQAPAPQIATAAKPVAPSMPNFSFGGVTLDSADFKDGRPGNILGEGALGDKTGKKTLSRVVLAIKNPKTGQIHLRSGIPYEKAQGLRKVEGYTGARANTGPSVLSMGKEQGDRRKGENRKLLDPSGSKQVLVEDLDRMGWPIIARLNLHDPVQVVQDFENEDQFREAWNLAEKLPGRSLAQRDIATGDESLEAADAEQAGVRTETKEVVLEDAENAAKAAGVTAVQVTAPAAPPIVAPPANNLVASIREQIGDKPLRSLWMKLRTMPEKDARVKFTKLIGAPDRPRVLDLFFESAPSRKEAFAGLFDTARNLPQLAPDLAKDDVVFDKDDGHAMSEVEIRSQTRRVSPRFAVGVVDGIGRVTTVVQGSASEAGDADHSTLFPQGGVRWRLQNGTVQWLSPHTIEDRLAVEEHLDREGASVSRHYDLAEGRTFPAISLRLDTRRPDRPLSERETAAFQAVALRLRRMGVDMRLIARALADLQGWAKDVAGFYSRSEAVVTLVMDDVINPSFSNLVTLLHETGHVLYGQINPVIRRRISESVGRVSEQMVADLRKDSDARDLSNPEEYLVERVATELAREGFSDSRTMAETIWDFVREMYLRAVLAARQMFGLPPAPDVAAEFLKARMQRFFGGSFDPASAASPARLATPWRIFTQEGEWVPHDYADPLTGRMVRPSMLPDSIEAAAYNMALPADAEYRLAGESGEVELPYRVASARIDVAAQSKVQAIMEAVHKAIDSKEAFAKFFARITKKGTPISIIEKIVTLEPEAAEAAIGGEGMTSAMNEKAEFRALRMAHILVRRMLSKAGRKIKAANQRADTLSTLARQANDLEAHVRDADVHAAVFQQRFDESIDSLAAAINDGIDNALEAGDLFATIKQFEGATDGVPADYQRVLMEVRDKRRVPIFDLMQEVAKLELDFAKARIADVKAAVEAAANAGNKQLAGLVKQKPLFAAIVSLVRNSTREMELLRLRVSQDAQQFAEIVADLDMIRNAGDAELANLRVQFEQAGEARSLRDRLKKEYLAVRTQMRTAEAFVTRSLEDAEILSRAAHAMGPHITELERAVGVQYTWEPVDGAKFIAMGHGEDGTWSRRDITLQMSGDTVSQAGNVARALIENRRWLNEHRDNAGTPDYELIKSQTTKLGLLDFSRKYESQHRWFADRLLQSLREKFAAAGGISGQRVAQRMQRFEFLLKTYADELQASARKWEAALQKTAKAAGYGDRWQQFRQDVYDPVIYAIESEPGLSDNEAAALRLAVRVASDTIAPTREVQPDFREQLANLLRVSKDQSERFVRIAEQNGVFVEDQRLKVKNPMTGATEFIKRHHIRQGWLTVPRKLRTGIIELLAGTMAKAGWTDSKKFDEVLSALASAETFDAAAFDAAIAPYFTSPVIADFVEPFIYKSGRSPFPAPLEAGTDRRRPIDQTQVQAAWEASVDDAGQPSMGRFIEALAVTAGVEVNVSTYAGEVLRQLDKLYAMELRIAEKSSAPSGLFDPYGGVSHRIMDARTNELLPPEHFEYDSFDQVSTRRAMAELAYHAAFGRHGSGIERDIQALEMDLQESARIYKERLAPLPHGERKAAAERLGLSLKTLERAHDNYRALNQWKDQWKIYFSEGSQAGVIGDARVGLELVSFATTMILNQPKSGLWNLPSIGDFPILFRGVNRSSAAAMTRALGDFTKGVFGSFLEGVGLQILKSSEYAKEVGELIDHNQVNQLTLRELTAQVGAGGSFDEKRGQRVVRWIRQVRSLMGKGLNLRDIDPASKEFGQFNALWAPFSFISNRMVHGVAMGTIEAYERIVRKAVDYFENNPEAANDPTFKLTADMLGMSGGVFGDKGAFDYFAAKGVEYNMGTFEQVAREVIQRRRQQGAEARVLTKNQVHALAQMAMTEVSLESSVNSRPAELFNNPVLRYTFPLLGWPVAKMNQVHAALRTQEGQWEWLAAMKLLGTMAIWTLPVGLAYSLAMDEYDEEILGKKSNLREVDATFALPLIGPAISVMGGTERTFWQNATASLERIARAGNAYGLGADFVNGMVNWVDPTAGQRDAFSLDNRVLVASMIGNAKNALVNFVHQDYTATYSSVWRPLTSIIGGQSVLQYWQIFNRVSGADNVERRVTDAINANNHLRSAGRAVGLELKAGAGRSSPTPVSVWVREMQLAAYANDRTGFLGAYRNAIDAARKDGREDPEESVLQSWRSRHPMLSVFRARPTAAEEARLYSEMDDTGARDVRFAVTMHEQFGELIEPSPIEKMMQRRMQAKAAPSMDSIRRRLANQLGM